MSDDISVKQSYSWTVRSIQHSHESHKNTIKPDAGVLVNGVLTHVHITKQQTDSLLTVVSSKSLYRHRIE